MKGLHFGSSLFDTTGEHDMRNVQLFMSFCGGHQISIENLLDKFCNHRSHINDRDAVYTFALHILFNIL